MIGNAMIRWSFVVAAFLIMQPSVGSAFAQNSDIQIWAPNDDYRVLTAADYSADSYFSATTNPFSDDSVILAQGFSTDMYTLSSLNWQTGETAWQFSDVNAWKSIEDGFLISQFNVGIIRIDSEGGTVWTYPADGSSIERLEVRGERLFVQSVSQLLAIDLETGTDIWQSRIPMDVGVAYVDDSIVAVLGYAGDHLEAAGLDQATGDPVWNLQHTAIEIYPEERLVEFHGSSGEGTVYDLETGRELVTYSQARLLPISPDLFAIASLDLAGTSAIYERATGAIRLEKSGSFDRIANDIVLFRSRDADGDSIDAYQLDSGENVWTYRVPMMEGFVASDGYLIIFGDQGVAVLSIGHGTVIEKRDDLHWEEIKNLFVAVGDSVVVARDQTVRMVDAVSGEERWMVGMPDQITGIHEFGEMVIAQAYQSLYGLDPDSGEQRWHFEVPGNGSYLHQVDDLLLVGAATQLFGVDLFSGQLRWTVDLAEGAQSLTVFGELVHVDAFRTYAVIDLGTGAIIWQTNAYDQIRPLWRNGDAALLMVPTSSDGGQVILVGKS